MQTFSIQLPYDASSPRQSPLPLLLLLRHPEIPTFSTILFHSFTHRDASHQVPHRLLHLLYPLFRSLFSLRRFREGRLQRPDLGEEPGRE